MFCEIDVLEEEVASLRVSRVVINAAETFCGGKLEGRGLWILSLRSCACERNGGSLGFEL